MLPAFHSVRAPTPARECRASAIALNEAIGKRAQAAELREKLAVLAPWPGVAPAE
jgi:hypothetical protein